MAHCYPYTYSQLQTFLKERIEQDPIRSNVCKRKQLCETIAGNVCDVLVVTNFESDEEAE